MGLPISLGVNSRVLAMPSTPPCDLGSFYLPDFMFFHRASPMLCHSHTGLLATSQHSKATVHALDLLFLLFRTHFAPNHCNANFSPPSFPWHSLTFSKNLTLTTLLKLWSLLRTPSMCLTLLYSSFPTPAWLFSLSSKLYNLHSYYVCCLYSINLPN